MDLLKKYIKHLFIVIFPILLNSFIYFLWDASLIKVEDTTHLVTLIISCVLLFCVVLIKSDVLENK